ncbi:MAG TPA: hypothetical protein VGM07_17120 [Stellaceae bacterium]|jgi:hypothetical protein
MSLIPADTDTLLRQAPMTADAPRHDRLALRAAAITKMVAERDIPPDMRENAALIADAQGWRMYPRLAAACDRIACTCAHRELDEAACREAEAAYADEMLSVILGGEWRLVPRRRCPRLAQPVSFFAPRGPSKLYGFSSYDHALFEHYRTYRRRGTRGRATWRDTAVLGMPYDGAWCGEPEAVSSVASWFPVAGVGLWTRRDLSAWCPGRTRLVIAAPGLIGRDPTEFGFQETTPTNPEA